MRRYVYVVVRCVPDPRTGEFVNMGAIAGSIENGEWAVRSFEVTKHIKTRTDSASRNAVHAFLDRVSESVSTAQRLGSDQAAIRDTSWLEAMGAHSRNVVQVSEPMAVLADTAERALDLVSARLVVDEPTRKAAGISKRTIEKLIGDGYRAANVRSELIRPHVEMIIGDRLRTDMDFAIANGHAVQLSQAWSFQLADVDDLESRVRSWGYGVQRLRDSEPEDARVLSGDEQVSTIDPACQIIAVVAEPLTVEQGKVFDTAQEIFADLSVEMMTMKHAAEVGMKAKPLVAARLSH